MWHECYQPSEGELMQNKVYDQQIVIDLEFTPVPKKLRRCGIAAEIIEIGAVRIDAQGRVADSFSCFVKPQFSWQIPDHIRDLTGIGMADVHDADPLEVALERLAAWIGEGHTRMVAWSDSDRNQIRRECKAKGLKVPAQLARWLDLQRVFPRVLGVGNKKHMALREAADWYGVAVDQGSAHRALYDAEVTARLLLLIISGEYRAHRSALDHVIVVYDSATQPLMASLGSRCDALAQLRASMMPACA